MNAKKRASNAVMKIATQKGWVKEHKFGPFDAISALRLNVSTIDKRLAAALEDPSREKDGQIFPFVDIIGEDFFQFVMANLCRELDPTADGGGVGAVANGPIRMKQRNHVIEENIVLYYTGILRDGNFVADHGSAPHSIQLRGGMDRNHEIWCVPYGFVHPYTALNGLCHVKGDFDGDVTTLNPGGCVMISSSFVGRLELFYGGNLTHSIGSGALIFREPFESEQPSAIDQLVVPVAVQADAPAKGRTRNPTTFFTIGQAADFPPPWWWWWWWWWCWTSDEQHLLQ